MQVRSLVVAVHLTSLVAGALIAPAATAQYRWVAPDGTVSYGDQPPSSGVRNVAPVAGTAVQASAEPGLPAALRSTVTKFPVTLYTTDQCHPCQSARSHLVSRGVPFIERSVRTYTDFEAYKKLGFSGDGFPVVTIGRDRSTGFEAAALDRSLDAAGYPQSSTLPRNYRHAPAQALTGPAPTPVAASRIESAATVASDVSAAQSSQSTPFDGGVRALRDPAPSSGAPTLRF